ncbi:MAG: hypothetical protein K5656_05585 [Lachnospiraceae bacterium]|nr:hypothetical protein [Lachnospiraceae bacterium]
MNGIIDKLNSFIDKVTEGWLNATEGKRKRPADNYSGFLWLVGIILLIIDIFIKNLPVLIIGIVMIVYGVLRCFLPFSFHDSENRIFESMCSGIVNGFKSFGKGFVKGAKNIKEAEKPKPLSGVKAKMSEASEERKRKAERKKAEAALKREEEEAAWEARNAALAEYRARRAGNANPAQTTTNATANQTAPSTESAANQANASTPDVTATSASATTPGTTSWQSDLTAKASAETATAATTASAAVSSAATTAGGAPTATTAVATAAPTQTVAAGVSSVATETSTAATASTASPNVSQAAITPSATETTSTAASSLTASPKPSVSANTSEDAKQDSSSTASEEDEPRIEQRIGDKRYYVFECPGCGQKVRIPNRGKKGRVAIVCPGCSTRFVKLRW